MLSLVSTLPCCHAGREASPEAASPTFQPAAAACVLGAVAVPVRTVQKAHPLTPSRQVVLEEEEQVCGSASLLDSSRRRCVCRTCL